MTQHVIFNMPLDYGDDRFVLVDSVPKKGETVIIDEQAYEVVKVLHIVTGPILRSKEPICYLAHERGGLTQTEKRYLTQRKS